MQSLRRSSTKKMFGGLSGGSSAPPRTPTPPPSSLSLDPSLPIGGPRKVSASSSNDDAGAEIVLDEPNARKPPQPAKWDRKQSAAASRKASQFEVKPLIPSWARVTAASILLAGSLYLVWLANVPPAVDELGGGYGVVFPSRPTELPSIKVKTGDAMHFQAKVDGASYIAYYLPNAGGAPSDVVIDGIFDRVELLGKVFRQDEFEILNAKVIETGLEPSLHGRARAFFTGTDAWVLAVLAPDKGEIADLKEARNFLGSLQAAKRVNKK